MSELKTDRLSHSKTPEYRSWQGMKTRCYSKKFDGYFRYGGRGITVCDEWRDSFEVFLKDMGNKPSPSHSIDRINTDGNYEPSNCRWASKSEQVFNRRVKIGDYARPIPRNGRFFIRLKDKINGVDVHVGTFDTIEETETAYRLAYFEWFGCLPLMIDRRRK